MSASSLGPKEGWIVDPTSIGEENETPFIRVWKPLPSRDIVKTLRESPRGKAQRGQYRLSVGLGSCIYTSLKFTSHKGFMSTNNQ